MTEGYSNAQPGVARFGNWMQTFTGRQFWPRDPRPEEVYIEDIAHSLSLQCRYAGHCEEFYSVAEHSVLCSLIVPREHALTALMHDATEAYLVDVPRPIKYDIGGYTQIEQELALVIGEKFGLPLADLPACVKEADNAVLLAEAEQIMKPHPAPWSVPGTPAGVKVQCLPPKEAERLFFAWFRHYSRDHEEQKI